MNLYTKTSEVSKTLEVLTAQLIVIYSLKTRTLISFVQSYVLLGGQDERDIQDFSFMHPNYPG